MGEKTLTNVIFSRCFFIQPSKTKGLLDVPRSWRSSRGSASWRTRPRMSASRCWNGRLRRTSTSMPWRRVGSWMFEKLSSQSWFLKGCFFFYFWHLIFRFSGSENWFKTTIEKLDSGVSKFLFMFFFFFFFSGILEMVVPRKNLWQLVHVVAPLTMGFSQGMIVDLEYNLRRALDRRKQRSYVVPPANGPKCVQCGRETSFRAWYLGSSWSIGHGKTRLNISKV